MTEPIYEYAFQEQFELTEQLSEEALEYFAVLGDDEPAIRHLIRYFLVPVHHAHRDVVQEHTRRALLWFMYCASDQRRLSDVGQHGYGWPFVLPRPLDLFFRWWWEELYGTEPPPPGDICDAEYKSGYPPWWKDSYPEVEVHPDVVKFSRRDGKQPGEGAPTQLYSKGVPPPPTRPRDSSRFLRWEDQANAIKHAEEVHAVTGQHKVWVTFPHVVGEGYLIGGEEYRETAVACVRFRDGGAVDSWPDLRKGWKPE